MTRIDDRDVVQREYAREDGLRARAAVYQALAGPDAREIVFEAVRDGSPSRVLDVGCGWGELAARLQEELGASVVGVDLSPRMVELARERGVDARVGDAQELAFEDGAFDCVIACWMLYHVPDIHLALGELGRVLAAGGRFVASTNGRRHLEELWTLVGRDKSTEARHFFAEDGEELLRAHFTRVTRTDIESSLTFADAAAVRGYVSSSICHKHLADRVPSELGPLVATRRATVFVAEKAA